MNDQYIVYTYVEENGETVCHAYGPGTQAACQAEGEKLQAATPALGFMVVLLEELPA